MPRGRGPIAAASAGTHPGEWIHPGAVEAADRHGLALPDVAPQRLDAVQRAGDLVITVCDRAHEELGPLGWAHWHQSPALSLTRAAAQVGDMSPQP
jgi:protein-tyrosine-phosphatase